MTEIRWGIIAPGNIAASFAAALNGIDTAVCYAVAGRDSGRARAFANHHGFHKSYGDHRQLLADPSVDAVYIASPHSAHEAHALASLQAGKATLCEKPMTVNRHQAKHVLAAATASNTFFMEAVWTRFMPIYADIREWLDQGRIGDVKMVQASFGIQVDYDPTHRLYDANLAGGATLDVGIYPITLSQWVFQQQPVSIKAVGHLGDSGVDEQVAVVMRYADGQLSQLGAAITGQTPHDAWIIGSHGKIQIHPQFWSSESATLTVNDRGHQDSQTISRPHAVNGYEYEIREVHRCLEAGLKQSQKMPWATSLLIIETMDEIRAQLGLQYPFE